jgi:hypothetical protein
MTNSEMDQATFEVLGIIEVLAFEDDSDNVVTCVAATLEVVARSDNVLQRWRWRNPGDSNG